MSLARLLEGFATYRGDVTVSGLVEDSRMVRQGDLFVAVRGATADGHEHAAAAVAAGAAAVVAERAIDGIGVPVVTVPDLRSRRGPLAARYYGHPGRALHCVGVTGTNGKTSIAHYLADLASRLGRPAGYLGTIGWGRIGALQPARLTTEDPLTVQQRLAALRDDGCQWAVLEVSSHALAQDRVVDVPFRTTVFSNLSRDHLDYHADADAYGAAKARLFRWPSLELAVLNVDDPFGAGLVATVPPSAQVLTYGTGTTSASPVGAASRPRSPEDRGREAAPTQVPDVRFADLDFSSGTARGRWHTPWGEAPLCLPVQAPFSVANVAAAVAVLCHAGFALDEVLNACRGLAPVAGRMERFTAPGRPVVVVDYAHTPDALDKVLAALRPATSGRLICVFGCGGDRDPGKRPLMAAAAERGADELWLTSDNPRSEDPQRIIADMRGGLAGRAPAVDCADRREAIARAVATADEEDIVLVAGKGHEDYQEINGRRRPFSDRAVVEELLEGAR